MDIFRMRCFVRAADTLNYSQTAKDMYITQSAVTQQISATEKELGVKLFRKKGRGLELTDAGAVFLTGIKSILITYDALCSQVTRLDTEQRELRIGYHGPLNWGTMLSLIQAFKEICPDVYLNIRTDHWGVLMHDLNQGSLDFVFTEQSEMEHYPRLSCISLFREGACVCMSRDNPLSQRDILNPQDLDGQVLIMTTSPQPSSSMNAIISRLALCGLDMEHAQFVTQFETALTMAGANMGITFLPRSFKAYEHSSLVYRDLDMPDFYMDMMLAYLPQQGNRAHESFLKLCESWSFSEGTANLSQREDK